MAVITISRDPGSGGMDIARKVAGALGYELANHDTTDAILRQYGLTKFSELYENVPSLLDILNADNLLIVAMTNEILEALAKRGNIVILGRAGFAVLSKFADVLNVRVQAPFDQRVKRVMEREGLTDLPAAEQRIKDEDNVHRKYVRRFYNCEWDDPANFSLALDTSVLSVDAAASLIVEAAKSVEQKARAGDAVTTATIKEDPVLADAVARVLAK